MPRAIDDWNGHREQLSRYDTKDCSPWVIVEPAPLTVSGMNEIIASFPTKGYARLWVIAQYGRRWRGRFALVRREALLEPDEWRQSWDDENRKYEEEHPDE